MDRFIIEVKALPILWDVNHMYFRDALKKRDTWEMVAEKCGMTDGEEAKLLWSKIRSSHREAMRRRAEDKHLKEWKYAKLMDFLLTRNNETYGSSVDTDNVVVTTETDSKNKFNIEVIKNDVTDEDSQTVNDKPVGLKVTTPILDQNKKDKSHTDTIRKINDNRKRLLEVENCVTDDTLRERQLVLSSPLNSGRKNDGLDQLFSCLCEKTRNLPKYLQLRVQREIFESITKAEEEALLSSDTLQGTRKRIKSKSRTKKKNVELSPQDHSYLEGNPNFILKTEEWSSNETVSSSEERELYNDSMENIVMKVDPDEENITIESILPS